MRTWDYLIVTAANEQQARAYEDQIRERRNRGGIVQVRKCLVVPDTDGKRIGSGGSTLESLVCVLQHERPGAGPRSFEEVKEILGGLRLLIIHAGGDSRRLPAYSHCGKMFVPIPVRDESPTASTVFDGLVRALAMLPDTKDGQVVVASGDALVLFDPSAVDFAKPGITALASFASPEDAAHHGVFCAEKNGVVRQYLQKPSHAKLIAAGAINDEGKTALDLGVMSCDAGAIVQLMSAFFRIGSQAHGTPALEWKPAAREALLSKGIDLYREICCALGTETTFEQYADRVLSGGSTVDGSLLAEWFGILRRLSLNLALLPRCKFLHFGTTRELITSGIALLAEGPAKPAGTALILNSSVCSEIAADHAWVEGCVVGKALRLDGFNTIVGVDVAEPLRLPKGVCLDMSAGVNREGAEVWFFRFYDIDDTFKHPAEEGGTFCGVPILSWLGAIGAQVSDIWPAGLPKADRTLWNARVFPAVKKHQEFRDWLWLLDVESATAEQKMSFLTTDRYSSSEIAVRVDQSQFHLRRERIRSAEIAESRKGPRS